MRILLLCPPPGDLSQPYVALPTLTAALRSHGRAVRQRDLNPEFFAWLRQPTIYAELLRRTRQRVGRAASCEWNDPSRALLLNDDDPTRLDEAIRLLQDPERYYDPAQFGPARRRIRQLFRLLSAAHDPWEIDLFRFAPPTSPLLPVAEVLRLLEAADGSPHHRFFAEQVVGPGPAPDLVGISVTYGQQLFPALHLARLFKTRQAATQVVLGGAAVTGFHRTFRKHPELFDLVDGVVLGDGEQALLGLVEALELGREPTEVPNLLRRVLPRSRGPGETAGPQGDRGQVVEGPRHEEELAGHATPDYEGLPLPDYLVPEVTLLVPVTRGCSWGRCAFCNFDALRCGYRERPAERVAADLGQLQDRHGTRTFYLTGNTVRPRSLRKLADALEATGRTFRWVVELRLDRGHRPETFQALYRSGCRFVMFGLESGSQRVQDLMHKGYQVHAFAPVLRAAADAGLRIGLETFIGFPGETPAEARATAAYLIEHRAEIACFTLGTFVLDPNSLVARHPEQFGVAVEGPPAEDLFPRFLPFRRTDPEAATEEQIQALNQELYQELSHHFPYTLERFGQGIGGPDPTLYAIHYPTAFFHTRPATSEPPPPAHVRELLTRRPTWAPGVVLRLPTQDPFLPEHPATSAPPPVLLVQEEDGSYLALDPSSRALLEQLDGRRNVAQVIRQSGLPSGDALELLFTVAEEGFLRLELALPTGPPGS